MVPKSNFFILGTEGGYIFCPPPRTTLGTRQPSSGPWNVGESVGCHFRVWLLKYPRSSSACPGFPSYQPVTGYPWEDSEAVEMGEARRRQEPGSLSPHFEESCQEHVNWTLHKGEVPSCCVKSLRFGAYCYNHGS